MTDEGKKRPKSRAGPSGAPAGWTALSVSEHYRRLFGADRLLVATHREPVIVSDLQTTGSNPPKDRPKLRYPAGGVSQSLHRLLLQTGGDWVSIQSSAGPDKMTVRLPGYPQSYDLTRLSFRDSAAEHSYQRFSNEILWPLFHEEAERIRLGSEDFEGYEAINREFAKKIGKILQARDTGVIWIHDYQLAMVASWIRKEIPVPGAPLAFFWHIPWPQERFLSMLPQRRAILSGLLDHDLLGFQTVLYRKRFLESVANEFQGEKNIRVEEDRIFKRDREIRVGAFPIGVDPGRFETLSLDPEGMKEATRLLCEQGIGTEDTFLISVDRMDYTKGFIMRLRILESLFRNFPEWIGKIRLLQIAPPTRSTHPVYQNYQKRVREEVRLTNARWSREDWIPVLPVERTVEQPVLAPLYRRAAGALVTSTNDGMNLVAKEYLSAQKDRGGVLFLSRYTGAAQGLKEVVLIDPLEPEKSAAILHNALQEPESIRKGRNAILREQISRYNIYQWMGSILTALDPKKPPSNVLPS